MSVAADEQQEERTATMPAGWTMVPLGEVATINPPRPPIHRADDAPTTFVPMAAVSERDAAITAPLLKPFREVRKGYTYFGEGDVLFAKITPCMQNGKHAIARALTDGIGFASTEFHVVRPGPSVLAEWIHLFIRQPAILEAATRTFNGTAGQQRVPEDFLTTLAFPLPSLSEQRRVAAILRKRMQSVERARHAAEQELEAAGTLVAAELRRVFPLHSDEDSCRLGDAASIASGVQKSPDRQPHSHHHPYLTVRNVQRGRLDLTRVERFEVTEAEFTRLRLQHDDILIVEGNGSLDHIGRNALFNAEIDGCIHQNHIIRVRCDASRLLPRFVSYFLNSPAGQVQMVEKARTSSGLYTLSTGKVASLSVPQRPLAEQHRDLLEIEQFQRAADRIRSASRDQLRLINSLPAALLREAFSGRL